MTTYQIDYSCGHVGDVVLIHGNVAQRDARAERLAKGTCRSCWRAAQIARGREEGNAALLALGDAAKTLPALQGTAKQVAWAGQIRSVALARLAQGASTTDEVRVNGLGEAARVAVARITSAAWFCDRGSASAGDVLLGAIGAWLAADRVAAIDVMAFSMAESVVDSFSEEIDARGAAEVMNPRVLEQSMTALIGMILGAWKRYYRAYSEPPQRPVSSHDCIEHLYRGLRETTRDLFETRGMDPLPEIEF